MHEATDAEINVLKPVGGNHFSVGKREGGRIVNLTFIGKP